PLPIPTRPPPGWCSSRIRSESAARSPLPRHQRQRFVCCPSVSCWCQFSPGLTFVGLILPPLPLPEEYMSSVVRRWSIALAITFSAPLVTSAQTGKVAPLLDRELFFGNPEISGAQISPDGRYVSFLKPYKDTRNVWVKRAGDPYSAAKLITNDTKRPVTQYFWSRDGKYILFAQDHLGDENFNVYAVDPAASPPTGQEVPAARNLTAATGVRAVIYDRPKNDPDIMYVGINDRDKAWHDLYKVRISTGQKALLRKHTEPIAGCQ